MTRPSLLVVPVKLMSGFRASRCLGSIALARSVSRTSIEDAGVPDSVSRAWQVIGGREEAIVDAVEEVRCDAKLSRRRLEEEDMRDAI